MAEAFLMSCPRISNVVAPPLILHLVQSTLDGATLMGQATGQDKIELEKRSDFEFVVSSVDAHIRFVKDDKGSVTGLVLEQGGQRIEAKKTE